MRAVSTHALDPKMAFGHEQPQPEHRPPEPDLAGGPGQPRRALVPVGMLMRPLYALADSIGAVFAIIWRVIRRLLERIAGRRDVQLEALIRPPGGVGESAGFLGENAAGAAKDAGEGIQEIVEEAAQVVQGQGAEAYLKLTMRRLGSQVVDARASLQTQQGRLREAAAPAASRLGVDPDELTALLVRERLDEATLAMDAGLPALREQAMAAQAAGARLDNLRARFVDYCDAAVRHGDPGARPRFEAIIRDALQSAGDPVLDDAVSLALHQLREGETAADGGQDENEGASAQPADPPLRRGRFSISAGQPGLEEGDAGAQPAESSRVPLSTRRAVDFDVLDPLPAQSSDDPIRPRE